MKFKVGDRVAFYSHSRKVSRVYAVLEEFVWVRDSSGLQYSVHEKQCRRLMKKKRMECWLNWDPQCGIQRSGVFLDENAAKRSNGAARQVHFREVIEKNE